MMKKSLCHVASFLKKSITVAALGMVAGLLPVELCAARGELKFSDVENSVGETIQEAYSLFQDESGYVYIGSDSGLTVYNGYDYFHYSNISSDISSLSDNSAISIASLSDGGIWIGTRKGLNQFDIERGEFRRFPVSQSMPALEDDYQFSALIGDGLGGLWAGTQKGLYHFNTKTEVFAAYPSERPYQVTSLVIDPDGIVWGGTRRTGVFSFDPRAEDFTWYSYDVNDLNTVTSDWITDIVMGDDGAIYATSRANYDFAGQLYGLGGLNRIDRVSKTVSRIVSSPESDNGLLENDLTAIIKDQFGQVWVGGLSGNIYEFESEDFKFECYLDASLRATSVTDIMVDRNGMLWVSREHGKVTIANTRSRFLFGWGNDSRDPLSLSSGEVTSIYEDRSGTLWVGMRNSGLNRSDNGTEKFKHFFPEDNASSLYEDSLGNFWVATYDTGLNLFNRDDNTVSRRYSSDLYGSRHMRVRAMLEDSHGNFWVGHLKGLDKLDRESGEIEKYRQGQGDGRSLIGNTVKSLMEDDEGFLWVGTNEGLTVLDPRNDEVRHFLHDPNDESTITSNRIRFLFQDSFANVWVGTELSLNRYSRDKQRFDRFEMESAGLSHSVLTGICEDASGKFWISSQNGISFFDPQTQRFLYYDQGIGLRNSGYREGAYFRSPKGTMYFGGKEGVDAFSAFGVNMDLSPSPIAIAEVIGLDRKSYDSTEVDGIRSVEISFDDSYVSFDFTVLDYVNSNRNQYRYQLKGFDEDWIESGAFHFANYTNLSPGSYEFQVQGANSRGVWNEEGAKVNLMVRPLYWQTVWFRASVIVFILLVIFSIHKYVTNQMQKVNNRLREANKSAAWANGLLEDSVKRSNELVLESEELARKAEAASVAKSQFLANMSHEIRTPLNGVVGMLSLLRLSNLTDEEKEYCEVADSSAHALLALLSDILDVSKIEVGELSLDVTNFVIRDLMRDVFELIRVKASEKGLGVRVNIEPDVPQVLSGDLGRLRQVLLNFMVNAVKFTRKGSVALHVFSRERSDDSITICFEVIDTGIGIAKEEQRRIFTTFAQVDSSNTREYDGAGLGLSICRQLVEMMGGNIEVESRQGLGSTFWFELAFGMPELANLGEDINQWGSSATDTSYIAREQKRTSERILIVENNRVNQRVAATMLERLDCETVCVDDGEVCLDLYVSGAFDMILMDCQMPGIDGFEATRRLRKQERNGQHVPIIAVTARAMKGDREKCIESGMDDYVSKPIIPKELERVVNRWGFQKRRD